MWAKVNQEHSHHEGAGVNQCLLPCLALKVCCSLPKLRYSRLTHETVLYQWGLTGIRVWITFISEWCFVRPSLCGIAGLVYRKINFIVIFVVIILCWCCNHHCSSGGKRGHGEDAHTILVDHFYTIPCAWLKPIERDRCRELWVSPIHIIPTVREGQQFHKGSQPIAVIVMVPPVSRPPVLSPFALYLSGCDTKKTMVVLVCVCVSVCECVSVCVRACVHGCVHTCACGLLQETRYYISTLIS